MIRIAVCSAKLTRQQFGFCQSGKVEKPLSSHAGGDWMSDKLPNHITLNGVTQM